jgi:hypothetical protein
MLGRAGLRGLDSVSRCTRFRPVAPLPGNVQVVQAGGSTGENSCHHSVHFVVNSAIGEHDGHLDDAVEADPADSQHGACPEGSAGSAPQFGPRLRPPVTWSTGPIPDRNTTAYRLANDPTGLALVERPCRGGWKY